METTAKKQRYYISFSNTLNNFFTGKLLFEDLKEGMFVFGRDRSAIVNAHIPARISLFNKEKPKIMPNHVPGGVISEDSLDKEVQQKWNKFAGLLLEKEKAGNIIWHRTNGESYLRLIVEYLRAGHDVVFDGELQKLEYYTWLDDETLTRPKKKKGKNDPREMQMDEVAAVYNPGVPRPRQPAPARFAEEAANPQRRRNNGEEREAAIAMEMMIDDPEGNPFN